MCRAAAPRRAMSTRNCIGTTNVKHWRLLFVCLFVCLFRFSLILFKIILRKSPWDGEEWSVSEILDRVIRPSAYGAIYRPNINKLPNCAPYISRCVSRLVVGLVLTIITICLTINRSKNVGAKTPKVDLTFALSTCAYERWRSD